MGVRVRSRSGWGLQSEKIRRKRERGKGKKLRSNKNIIFNKKSSQGSPRQACVFKALQKPVLCGSLCAEEAWLRAPAGEEQMLRLQVSL